MPTDWYYGGFDYSRTGDSWDWDNDGIFGECIGVQEYRDGVQYGKICYEMPTPPFQVAVGRIPTNDLSIWSSIFTSSYPATVQLQSIALFDAYTPEIDFLSAQTFANDRQLQFMKNNVGSALTVAQFNNMRSFDLFIYSTHGDPGLIEATPRINSGQGMTFIRTADIVGYTGDRRGIVIGDACSNAAFYAYDVSDNFGWNILLRGSSVFIGQLASNAFDSVSAHAFLAYLTTHSVGETMIEWIYEAHEQINGYSLLSPELYELFGDPAVRVNVSSPITATVTTTATSVSTVTVATTTITSSTVTLASARTSTETLTSTKSVTLTTGGSTATSLQTITATQSVTSTEVKTQTIALSTSVIISATTVLSTATYTSISTKSLLSGLTAPNVVAYALIVLGFLFVIFL